MKKFNFRLQTALDIAVRQEQIAREELLLCIKDRDTIAAELQDLNSRLQNLEDEIREGMNTSLPLERLLLLRNFLPVLRKRRDEKNQELFIAEERVEEARHILVERMKESKTLNRLREKEWAAYLQEMLREEQKEIDEVATTRHHRQSREERV